MSDYRLNYWIESVESSFEENGIIGTHKDIIEKIAKDMMISSECQSMAFYTPEPPKEDPRITELKKKYESRIAELEHRDQIFRESVAARRRVLPEDVYIKDDSVMYDTTHRW